MADNFDGWYDKWYPKMRPYTVPHYSKYKSIDGIWQLERTRDKLAKYGLKDPWMRNEIWRYQKFNEFAPGRFFLEVLCGKNYCGVKYGFLLFAAVIITQNVYWRYRYGEKPAYRDDFIDWIRKYEYARHHPNQ